VKHPTASDALKKKATPETKEAIALRQKEHNCHYFANLTPEEVVERNWKRRARRANQTPDQTPEEGGERKRKQREKYAANELTPEEVVERNRKRRARRAAQKLAKRPKRAAA
jgi:hypothetical protein